MTCLLPHFKCKLPSILLPSSTTTTSSSSSSSAPLLRSREVSCFRTHCAVSTSPPPSAVTDTVKFDIEKLRLAYAQSNSTLLPAYDPLTYVDPLDKPSDEGKFDSTSAAETILEDEEAVIAAAAAEALTLARAAAKLAKDAALMASTSQPSQPDTKPVLSDGQLLQLKSSQPLEKQPPLNNGNNIESSFDVLNGGDPTQCENSEPGDLEPSPEELQLLEAALAESIAVRSTRQVERNTKRSRAAEKTASTVVPIKATSSGRKKRTAVQEVDYNDPLRHLRGTTSTSKLLTAAEEIKLSAGIQDLLKLERLFDELKAKFGSEPSYVQWAAAADVDQRTLRSRITHGTMCKAKMIKSNIRLVISIAKNYQGAGMNLQDLVQEGCRGLIRGAEKFDASKGFKFSTYAHWWIKQAVRKSLSDQSRTIRLPFHMVEATYRVKEARKQLISENGRQPEDEEVAIATGLSMKRVNAVLMTPKAPRSLDQKVGLDMNLKPSDVIADPEAETSEDLLTKQFMKQDLEKVIDSLSTREGQVIRWRFGLEDGRMKTLQEIGELMGVSRERIRQIESSAFRKLQNKKRTKHLEQYLYS